MNVEEIRKKVRSLCEDAGLQFFFAVPNASEWAVNDCEHLRKIVSYHKELETLPLVTPKQEPVLDKIRAEIVDLGQRTMNDNRASGIWACRDIIDKYKKMESEE